MNFKLFMNMERRALYIILLSLVGILWYVCVWGIFEGLIDTIETKYRIDRIYQYTYIIATILLIIVIHPKILDIL